MNRPRQAVALVDDDAAVRDALTLLLGSVDIEAKAFESGDQFLDTADPADFSCIVLDIRMPGISGLDLQDELDRRGWHAPIVFITGHGDVGMAVRAMRNGAFHFLQKPFDEQQLLDCIRAALANAAIEERQQRDTEAIAERFDTLSPREREVMTLVTHGKPNKVIAYELDVSQRTVEIHRARVMKKMGARSLADLVRAQIQLDNRLGAAAD